MSPDLQSYNFKVVCWDCVRFKSAHVSLELYCIGAGDHSCSEDVLICSYLKGQSRTSHYYYYIGPADRKMQICPSLSMNVRCKNLKPGSVCTGWHSKTEHYFWKLELDSLFNRDDYLTTTRTTSDVNMSRMQSVPSDFLSEFKLILRCDQCCENLPANQKQHSFTQCRIMGRNHACPKNKLIGMAVGSNQVFQIRPFPGISSKPLLCNSIGRAVCPHIAKRGVCMYAHSEVERAFWTAEQKHRIIREDVIIELRGETSPRSQSGSVVNGETSTRPSTSMSSGSSNTQNQGNQKQASPLENQQQKQQQTRRVPDSNQDFINNLLRANPGNLIYICFLCYNAENKVRERVDDNDWCMKKHQFPDCFMLALFNLAGTKLLKIIREPPDESLSACSSFQFCRAPLDPRTQKCARNFCTFPHSEIEMEVWNFCVKQKVSYFSLAKQNRTNQRQAPPFSTAYSPGSATQSHETRTQQQQQQYRSPKQGLGDSASSNRAPRSPSNNSLTSRNISPSSAATTNHTGNFGGGRANSYGDVRNGSRSNTSSDPDCPEIYACCRSCYSNYKMSGNEACVKSCTHPTDSFVYYSSVLRNHQYMKEPQSIGVYFKPGREIVICKYGFACRALSRNDRCMFPHFAEEQKVWNIMLKNNWKRLRDYFTHVMKPRKQPPNASYASGDNGRVPDGRAGATNIGYTNGMSGPNTTGPARRIRAWQQQRNTINSPPTNPLFKRANIVSIYFCRYCNKHARSETELETHKRTKTHMEMEKMDLGRPWKYPPPPTYCDASKLKLCEVNEIGQCPSDRPDATDQCLDAHGQEMLNEWKERVDYRKAKGDVERSAQNKEFLEEITENYADATFKTEVVERNVDKLDIQGLQVCCEAPPYRTSAAMNERIVWPFLVRLPEDSKEVTLKRVALWHDTHRSHFCIKMTQMDQDSFMSQIVNDNDFQDNVHNNFTFYVHFQSEVIGTFKQSIILDFCQFPYLEIELVVDVGLHELSGQLRQDFKQVKEKAISDSTWNEKNIKVIKSKFRSDEDKLLLKNFPMKDMAAEVITADFMNMTNPLKWAFEKYEYKDILTRLMNIERFQCQEVLSTLNIHTNVTIRRKIGGDGLPTIYPDRCRNELLFGEVPLDANISLDTERGRILFHFSYFESIWLRPKEIIDEDVVFECTVINPNDNGVAFNGRQKDRFFVVITTEIAQMMSDYGLLPEDYYQETFKNVVLEDAEVQFKLNEVEFSKLAQSLDAIDDPMLMHLFPKNDLGLVKQASHQVKPMKVGHFNQLDEKQLQFMRMALVSPTERKDHPLPPLLLYGPLGMGKTFAVGNLIIQLLAANTSKRVNRVLVCTWTNSAADIYIREYLSRLGSGFSGKILRLNSDFRRPEPYDKVVMDYCLFNNEDRTAYRIPKMEELDQYDVVVSTVTGCRLMANNKSAMMPFTHIILDEAGQCLEVDALIPFKIATNKTRIIMAGDPNQQAPPVFSKIAKQYKYNLSPMERMFLLYNEMGNGMLDNNSIIFVNNYRCVQPILDFLSPQFYAGNKFIAKSTDYIPPEQYPLLFSHCQGKDIVRAHDMSYTNSEECERIVEEVNDLMINWPVNHWGHFQPSQICVLAPYHEQVKLIRQRLRANGIYGVDVQRVHNVQGREYRVVVISVVRTLEGHYDSLAQLQGEEQFHDIDLAFLSDKKLLNIAMSLAKNKIIVVGDAATMIFLGKCQEVWQAYIIHCIQNQSARPYNLHPVDIEQNLQQRQDALQEW